MPGLTAAQVEALLRPINPRRVLQDNKGMSHVSQQDVRAHLTRVFGFGGWSDEVRELTVVREAPGQDRQGKDKGWAVTYRALVRLTVKDPEGNPVASFDDVATGTSPNLPTLGDAHDFACKVAVSMALKRAATNLGDGFGLSLYNKGQTDPLVIDTLVKPDGPGRDAQDEVPQQTSLGHDDAGSAEDDSESEPPAAAPQPTPPVADDVTRVKRQIVTVGQALKLDVPGLAQRFHEWSKGGDLPTAELATLREFHGFLLGQVPPREGAA